ncbi:MAG TPA: halocarboxylic acid dehydrogenase DehI family protein [Candidatus Angelobacter sp.]|nr:halocarboxylic acid dehydrogenase DehI family protein [Candidatus Angelobacter sp.]
MAWKKQNVQLLPETEAKGEILEIYQEIKRALGIPYVNTMFQAFAPYPKYFIMFWRALQPVLETNEFFDAAERIAAEAYTRVHNYMNVPDLSRKVEELDFSIGAQEELRDTIDLYVYNNSVLLLISAAQIQALENPSNATRPGTVPAVHPVHPRRPVLVDEKHAPPDTQKIYEDIKKTMGAPFLNTSYINFGRWPDFLREYWSSLKPVLLSPLYEQTRIGMQQSALGLVAELPRPLQLSSAQLEDAGISHASLSSIIQTTEFFMLLLSRHLLNITFAKIGLEGGVQSAAA